MKLWTILGLAKELNTPPISIVEVIREKHLKQIEAGKIVRIPLDAHDVKTLDLYIAATRSWRKHQNRLATRI